MSRIVRPFVAMLLLALPCVAAQPNGTGGVSPSRAAPVADSLPSSAALQVLGRILNPSTPRANYRRRRVARRAMRRPPIRHSSTGVR
jgi:hypothetical protein